MDFEYNEDLVKEYFGKQLTRYLELNSRTQVELSEHLGVSKQIVSAWCQGKKLPRMGKIQGCADYLHCKKSDLTDYWKPDADKIRDELYEKRKILFDLSEKASSDDLDVIIRLVDKIIGGDK